MVSSSSETYIPVLLKGDMLVQLLLSCKYSSSGCPPNDVRKYFNSSC